jgi:hypothetical protein
MASDSERSKILEMIEEGTITAEEGLTLLNALGESSAPETTVDDLEAEPVSLPEPEGFIETVEFEDEVPASLPLQENVLNQRAFDEAETEGAFEEVETFEGEAEILPPDPAPPSAEEIKKWKRWWVIPLWIGAGITVIGGLLMYWAFSASGFGFWFACAWFPFLLGVALLALAWGSRTAPWLHVRVHQAHGERPQKIAISFPIPVRLTAWGLRTFGHFIPHMEDTSLDEVILALKDVATDETPLFVDVDEGENGERVQVFIG